MQNTRRKKGVVVVGGGGPSQEGESTAIETLDGKKQKGKQRRRRRGKSKLGVGNSMPGRRRRKEARQDGGAKTGGLSRNCAK